MSELEALESVFGQPPATRTNIAARTSASVTGGYERRLASLKGASGHKYERCLEGDHSYTSDSEASMAVVDAMVARHFSDGEIWATLQPSALYAARVERKGEAHARQLYAAEIAKARQLVSPFARDPGEERRQVRVVRGVGPSFAVPPSEPPDLIPLTLPAGNDWLSQYVRYASVRTDAPLEAHQLMAAVVLSFLAGPMVRLPIATSRRGWNLCIWGMYIVNSTVGRKSTVIGLAKDILIEVSGPEALIEWEGSPQGLLQHLQERDGIGAVFARDEYSGLMAQMNRSGGHMAGLPQLFIKAFDGGVLENIRTKKRLTKSGPKEDDTDRVEMPYLPKLAASTWDSFMERCTIDNVLDGFLARFAFVTGSAEPRPLPLLTASMNAAFDALVAHAKTFERKAHAVSSVTLTEDVVALAWALEQRWLREAAECSRPDAAGPSMKRLSETVLKLAGLLAIDAAAVGEQPAITPAIFATAEEVGERWKVSTLRVVESLGATSFMRDVDAVCDTIRQHPLGIQVRDLSRKHRRIRLRDFDEILLVLEEREQIEVVEVSGERGRGRHKRVAYPFGHAPEANQA